MPALANPKHEAFAMARARGMGVGQAYVEAGYKAHAGNATRLSENEKVLSRVAELLEHVAERSAIDAARTLDELGRIGFSDLRHAFTPDGRLLPVHQWPDDLARAVASVEIVTKTIGGSKDEAPEVEYVHKIRLWPKNDALNTIAKHLGMLVDRGKLEITATGALAEALARAVEAKPALPVGQRPALRVVGD